MGDTIPFSDTLNIFSRNENKVFNTNLFVTVEINVKQIDTLNPSAVHLIVLLKERWYIFPLPILELADRNFNEWRTQRNSDIRRIEWGMRFDHDNFRGRNEKLNIVLQGGFTKKYEIFHQLPYINKKKTLGIRYGISYSTNKSVGYNTVNNKLIFHNSDEVLRKRFYTTLSLKHRPKFYFSQEIGLNFRHNRINPNLLNVSTFYLGENRTIQRFFRLYYAANINKTDINFYPNKGYEIDFLAFRDGLGIVNEVNLTTIKGHFSKYFELKPKLFLATRLSYRASTPLLQSYILQKGLGYDENFVRGYEPYVVEGQRFALHRTDFKYKILSFTHDWKKLMPLEEFRVVPYTIYIKLFSDFGYADNRDNRLESDFSNQLNSGYGIGVDIVSFYDLVFRFEYAINDRKESGLYFHFQKGI